MCWFSASRCNREGPWFESMCSHNKKVSDNCLKPFFITLFFELIYIFALSLLIHPLHLQLLKSVKFHFILFITSLLLFTACNPAGKVARRGGYLLVNTTVKCDNSYLPTDELDGFVQQNEMPGNFVRWFRPGVYFAENSERGRGDTHFKAFMRKNFGKTPVIFDSTMAVMTVDKLGQYMKNKGFFHATVTMDIRKKSKTVSVGYNVKSGPPCIVRNFKYFIPDSIMQHYIMSDTAAGKLRTGMIFDTYALDDDRERIATVLRNNSYYNFSLSDIYYIADTTNHGLSAEVELYIKKIRMITTDQADSTVEIQHPRFFIRNIYIITNAEATQQIKPYDTLVYSYRQNKSDTGSKIHILYTDKLTLKPAFLSSCMQFSTGNPYSQQAANNTYKKLISQPIIGATNISMTMKNPEQAAVGEKQWLDCNIRMIRNRRNTFTIGTEGTNSGGRFGMGVNTSIQNRNIFKGAEVLSLKLHTSAELQGSLNNQNTGSNSYLLIFNTLEAGAEASIDFPRLLLPYRSRYMQSSTQARTMVSAGAGLEFRPEYKRTVSTAAWSYKWNTTEKVKHIFTPLELNFIRIFPSDSFQSYLESLIDPVYKSQYTNHLLTMIRYSIIISNFGVTKNNNQFFLRLNAETSGNIPYMLDNLTSRPVNSEGYYERFGVRYSQFARFDADFRRYWRLRPQHSIAFRVLTGIALPYGNSVSVPFEKSFWLGGANDMRGWRLRSLGPGAYSATDVRYDKTGDIMLQSSLEYRFPIYSFLLGSLFTDAGNVWLRKKSEDFPGGEFNLNTFYKQIAVDAGVGLRFDFSFFIFRLDAALAINNPARATSSWFNAEDFKLRKTIWNFGIGYPF